MTSTTTKKTAKKPRRMAREPKLETASTPISPGANDGSTTAPGGDAKPPTKSTVVLGLLTRSQGATLGQLVEATGWLPHTTRAALTGLKKKGLEVTSVKVDGVRTYRATKRLESDKPDERRPTETADA